MRRRTFVKMLGSTCVAGTAFAQSGTGKPIRIIVPLSTGTPSDAVARIVAPKLSSLLGQSVIVDNKPGANGLIAVQDLMRSPADGSALMMGSVSFLGINVALVKNLSYDPRRDLTPIAGVYSGNHAWMVHPGVAARSLSELVALAKARPGQLRAGYGSTLVQVQLLAFEKMAGVEFLKIPYKSTATNTTDLMGGTLDLGLLDMGTAMVLARDGKLRALATSPLKRHPLTPDWPAVSETLPGYDIASWSALVGPAGMSQDGVSRISDAIAQILRQKDVIESLAKAGTVPMAMTPPQLQDHIAAEVTKFITIARQANLEPE
ncbi:Bug family tripartite tricarboxylate transporter substrate binding protein [Azohydromonas australica]|uniref:Bug family tripartite tricarboxylate transporter substrate binding protein n=1 Tax=Azohydromonas australica TaxID=364039 RepID=UPI000407353F|nr:tripartite tricarboxylate transporter substrate-binding protein [Azohydromonas australica]